MTSVSRWRDSGHLERAVQTSGGRQAFDAAVAAMLNDARSGRLAGAAQDRLNVQPADGGVPTAPRAW